MIVTISWNLYRQKTMISVRSKLVLIIITGSWSPDRQANPAWLASGNPYWFQSKSRPKLSHVHSQKHRILMKTVANLKRKPDMPQVTHAISVLERKRGFSGTPICSKRTWTFVYYKKPSLLSEICLRGKRLDLHELNYRNKTLRDELEVYPKASKCPEQMMVKSGDRVLFVV